MDGAGDFAEHARVQAVSGGDLEGAARIVNEHNRRMRAQRRDNRYTDEADVVMGERAPGPEDIELASLFAGLMLIDDSPKKRKCSGQARPTTRGRTKRRTRGGRRRRGGRGRCRKSRKKKGRR